MKVKVISVFAGLGKTTVSKKYPNVCDLQSSIYRCDYSNIDKKDYEKMKCNSSRTVNKAWPNNYLEALKKAINEYDLVLVPSNPDIRELLLENNINFIFVLPSSDSREVLLDRYKKRGNNKELIEEVTNYFDTWSRKQKDYDYKIKIIEKDKYLEDLLLDLGYLK